MYTYYKAHEMTIYILAVRITLGAALPYTTRAKFIQQNIDSP